MIAFKPGVKFPWSSNALILTAPRPTLTGSNISYLSAMRRRNDICVFSRVFFSGVFFQTLNTQKLVFGRGSTPDPAGGAYDTPPDSLVGWERGHSLPISFPLDAFGVSISVPSVPRLSCRPLTQIPGYAYGLPHFFLVYSWPTLSKKPASPLGLHDI